MIWSHLLQLLVWCSPMVVLSLRPALRVAADRRPAMRTLSRRYAADDGDETIINYEDLPELGACEPKKHKDPVSKEGEAPLTDRFLMAARALRGEFDPEESNNDTEENSQLLGAIIETYPAPLFLHGRRAERRQRRGRAIARRRADQGRERLLRRRFCGCRRDAAGSAASSRPCGSRPTSSRRR